MKKILLILAVALIVVGAVPFVVGSFLPREHRASVEVRLEQPRDKVWDVVSDFDAMPTWFEGAGALKRTGEKDGLPSYEVADEQMKLTFTFVEVRRPERLIVDLKDDAGYFGGRWIYTLHSSGGETVVTITEEGWVEPAFFRFMTMVFGADATLKAYADALAKKMGA